MLIRKQAAYWLTITAMVCSSISHANAGNHQSQWSAPSSMREYSAHQIKSFSTTIEASGEIADVYFPAVPDKWRTLFADQFPLVLFMQGALVDKEYYSIFAQGLARHGFVVVVPNQASSVFGNQELFAELNTINEVLEHMRQEDSRANSPVHGIVDTSRLGLSGHSFGGAASLFAVGNVCFFPFCDPASGFQRPAELQAAALVGAHVPGFDFDTSGVPLALIGGEYEANLDRIEQTYANIETPRALIIISDANHFGLADIGAPPGAEINPEEEPQSTPQAITAVNFARWAGLYLRAHLHQDWRAWWQVYKSGGDNNASISAEFR